MVIFLFDCGQYFFIWKMMQCLSKLSPYVKFIFRGFIKKYLMIMDFYSIWIYDKLLQDPHRAA